MKKQVKKMRSGFTLIEMTISKFVQKLRATQLKRHSIAILSPFNTIFLISFLTTSVLSS